MNTQSVGPMISRVASTFALAICVGCRQSTFEPAQVNNQPQNLQLTQVTTTTLSGIAQEKKETPMKLGNFSVSLAVKDLSVSRAFYEKLGFKAIFGNAKNFLILQNETCTIGLYQGMFEKNILTFNPGWDKSGTALSEFEDVREIQRALKAQGIALTTTADESTTGPASMTLVDPDGNQILFDQHVPSPKKYKQK